MDQHQISIGREWAIAVLLGIAGCVVLAFSIAETPSSSLIPVQILIAVFCTAWVIIADRYPIHLGRGTKASLTSLPIFLGAVLLPAPLAVVVAGSGMLITNLLLRVDRGLLPRDIISTTGQWMVIAFLGFWVNHLTIPGMELNSTKFILLALSALTFLVIDFTIFSLSNSFVLKEPFPRTLKDTFREGIGIEGIQLLIAILGALAIEESIWALPLLIIPAVITYVTFKKIKEVGLGTLQLLKDMADSVDLRDIYTGGHSRRVAELVRQILIQLDIHGQEAAIIETAARLHDIGKIGIPDDVLQKCSRLSPEEKAVMQTHSDLGAGLISKYKDFHRGALMIKHHHEKWSGHGYPDHLQAHEIPFGSRVIAVADSFDSMTSDRPYRKALSAGQAIQVLLEGRGSQWDHLVVNALVDSLPSQMDDPSNIRLSEMEIALALSNTI